MDKPLDVTFTDPPSTSSSIWTPFLDNPISNIVRDAYNGFSRRREALGLSNPGSVENIGREVSRDVLLTQLMFSGLRADLTKSLSTTNVFHIAHNFSMGAQGMQPYTLAALYGSPKVFLQGMFDNEYQVNGRANYRWTDSLVTKTNFSLAPGGGNSMIQFDSEYSGDDFNANVQAMNPSILEGPLTGIVIGSYMQSVTPSLALGVQAMWQRQAGGEPPQALLSYAARYKGKDWIGSAQMLAQGGLQATYWRRLSEKVEAGIECHLQFLGLSGAGALGPMMGPAGNEGVTTLGAKYDFRLATFRGQIDSNGKVSALLEKRMMSGAPITFTFAGEIDHPKNNARVGLAISLESMPEELQQAAMEEQQAGAQAQPPPF